MKELSLTEKKKVMSMNKIVRDSLHYFEKNGYYNTSVDKICEEAMISRSTFFNYFGNKEKVIKLIMEDGLQDLKDVIGSVDIMSEEDPVECLMKILVFQLKATKKYKNTTFVFYRMMMEDEECCRIKNSFDEEIAILVEQIQERLEFKNKQSRQWIKNVFGGAFLDIVILTPEEDWEKSVRETIGGVIEMMK